MPSVEHGIEIGASPETVWGILSDFTYMSKIFPDVVSAKVDPLGPAAVGQIIKILGKMAGRKKEMSAEDSEVEHEKKLEVKADPGGPVKT